MPYDPYGRTPAQARRDRREAWCALLLSAAVAAALALCCCGPATRPCPCGCRGEVAADGS